MAKVTRADLISRAQTIRAETGDRLNTAERVGSFIEDTADTLILTLNVVSAPVVDTTVNWGENTILETSATAATATIASLTGVSLESFCVIENYTGNDITLILTDGAFRGATPAGGHLVPNNEKCHLQITGAGLVSLIGTGADVNNLSQLTDDVGYTLNSELGWAQFSDDAYTQASPFSIVSNTRTLLPNNSATLLNVNAPTDAVNWWGGDKFNPPNSGDFYNWRVQFEINSVLNNRNLTLELDIGGTQGVIWSRTIRLARGAGTDTSISENINIFTLNTFVANGGELYITVDGDCDIYDISSLINRTFKA